MFSMASFGKPGRGDALQFGSDPSRCADRWPCSKDRFGNVGSLYDCRKPPMARAPDRNSRLEDLWRSLRFATLRAVGGFDLRTAGFRILNSKP